MPKHPKNKIIFVKKSISSLNSAGKNSNPELEIPEMDDYQFIGVVLERSDYLCIPSPPLSVLSYNDFNDV
jgi:hypothetical protein